MGAADFVNGSTGSVYGPRGDRPSKETDFPCPDTEYGRARMAQEQMIENLAREAGGSRVIHLRYFYGVRMGGGVVQTMAKDMMDGIALGDTPDKLLQIIGVSDLVRCTLNAPQFAAMPAEVVNVCHPEVWSMKELAERV